MVVQSGISALLPHHLTQAEQQNQATYETMVADVLKRRGKHNEFEKPGSLSVVVGIGVG